MMSEHIDFAKLKGSNVLPSPKGVRRAIMRLCQRESTRSTHMAAAIADLCMSSDNARDNLIAPLFVLAQVVGIRREDVAASINQTSTAWVEWGTVLQVQTSALPPVSAEDIIAP